MSNKNAKGDGPYSPNAAGEEGAGGLFSNREAILALLAYSACSGSMLLVNKIILKGYEFMYPACLLSAQSLISIIFIKALQMFGFLELPKFSVTKGLPILPLSIAFAFLLYSGSAALYYLSVPTLTVFKNTTNIFVGVGETFFFGKEQGWMIYASFFLMLFGAVCTGYTDLEYSAMGYTWICVNILSQASYSLYMRHAAASFSMSKWEMTFYNNFYGMFVFALGTLSKSESDVWQQDQWEDKYFVALLIVSGCLGTLLGLSAVWFVSCTSATTYGITGSLNKIPVVILGAIIFNTPMGPKQLLSISVGIGSGIVYAYARSVEQKKPAPKL